MVQETKMHSFASGFKETFKKERKRAGYTQISFANSFGVSLDTVRNWEQGRKVPEIKTIERLCTEFGCEPDYLLGRMESSTHDIQYIRGQTGLSEDAILSLKRLKEYDRAVIQVLDFLLTNHTVLEKIALYFAASFWDIESRIEFGPFIYMCKELGLSPGFQRIDTRLFIADVFDGISKGKEYFYRLYNEKNDIKRQMVFRMLEEYMTQTDIDKMHTYAFNHKDDIESTHQLSLIAEFLVRSGDSEFMKHAGCDLERFYQSDSSSNIKGEIKNGTD